jgi:hypothetical protein
MEPHLARLAAARVAQAVIPVDKVELQAQAHQVTVARRVVTVHWV